MTLAKAKSVGAAIVDAGQSANLVPVKDLQNNIIDWKVYASSDKDITINSVKTLQDAQVVVGTVRDVMFI